MREAVLLYSREIAFSSADVYAKAAEARGLWDARLEALVVDSIISGEQEEELASRIAALGWRAQGSVCVVIGPAAVNFDQDDLRRKARKAKCDVLVGVQGNRVLVVIGQVPHELEGEVGHKVNFADVVADIEGLFGAGSIVIGPEVLAISSGHISAKAALSAFAVTKSINRPARIIGADELLAERALAGDSLAKASLVDKVYRPLSKHSPELLQTLVTYLDNGRSLENTAREMFVHPNTVRYRLKRIAEILGWDPTGAREAFVLQVAVVLGSMSTAVSKQKGRVE
jgi:sugar diacid utilization regulator